MAEDTFSRWITMDLHEHFTENEIALGVAKVAHHFLARKELSRLVGNPDGRS